MIDNKEHIKSLLTFENEGDFYQLFIFLRKKDQTTDKSNHQSVRTIKSYCITSHEYLDKRYDEIKMLCEVFKARAYLHVAKQNHKDVGMNMITEIVTRIQSGQTNQKNVFDSVVGQLKTQEKRWIVDIDEKDSLLWFYVCLFIDEELRPEGKKTEKVVQTKNGFHIVTKRFDMMEFKKRYPNIDVVKKNPTLLYYPNSLDDGQIT